MDTTSFRSRRLIHNAQIGDGVSAAYQSPFLKPLYIVESLCHARHMWAHLAGGIVRAGANWVNRPWKCGGAGDEESRHGLHEPKEGTRKGTV